MWTAPSSQGVLQCFDQIACVHMSGLFLRSHMNAGQDGFRNESSIRLICSTDGLLCLRSATTSFWHARCRRGPSTQTDGRGRRVTVDVPGNPLADRPAAGTARARVTAGWDQMRQATTAEVRLDHGKVAGSGLTGEESGGSATNGGHERRRSRSNLVAAEPPGTKDQVQRGRESRGKSD
jgi:hypothetical protein